MRAAVQDLAGEVRRGRRLARPNSPPREGIRRRPWLRVERAPTTSRIVLVLPRLPALA